MSRVGRRECYVLDLKGGELDLFVKEIKSFIAKENFPDGYTVDVYKDQAVCCGVFPLGIAVEIEGLKEQTIKALDVKLYSKIMEVCEREGFENHQCEPLKVL